MLFKSTPIKGAWIVDLEKIGDERGFFARAWCADEFKNQGITSNLHQANISYSSKKGTLRGMHYQIPPHSEMKAIRCIRGALFDVIIDLRQESATYKKWFGYELNQDNKKMLIVPEGCAHGFLTLSNDCEALYFVSSPFNQDSERGLRWDDPSFNIKWPFNPIEISHKDKSWSNYE
jgi:dTDP-4-dehydrorhamnose 3,5-epimerase